MTKTIKEIVLEAIAEQSQLDMSEIDLQDCLFADLALDSLDIVELEMLLEEKLNINNEYHANNWYDTTKTVKELIWYIEERYDEVTQCQKK